MLLDESSKEKTGFFTHDNQFQFERVAFVLCNAPSFFMRVISILIKKMSGTDVIAYLDDICIPWYTVEVGLKKLKIALQVIREWGLTLNLKKISFL